MTLQVMMDTLTFNKGFYRAEHKKKHSNSCARKRGRENEPDTSAQEMR